MFASLLARGLPHLRARDDGGRLAFGMEMQGRFWTEADEMAGNQPISTSRALASCRTHRERTPLRQPITSYERPLFTFLSSNALYFLPPPWRSQSPDEASCKRAKTSRASARLRPQSIPTLIHSADKLFLEPAYYHVPRHGSVVRPQATRGKSSSSLLPPISSRSLSARKIRGGDCRISKPCGNPLTRCLLLRAAPFPDSRGPHESELCHTAARVDDEAIKLDNEQRKLLHQPCSLHVGI